MSDEITSMEAICNQPLIAGIRKIEYAALAFIENFPEYLSNDHEYKVAIGFKSGKDWLLAAFTKGSARYSVKQKKSEDGDLFPIQIKAEFPFDSPGSSELFKKLGKERFILRITDYSGNVYLVGTLKFPMRFDFEKLSGGNPGEFAGYKYDFFGLSTEVPPFYNP